MSSFDRMIKVRIVQAGMQTYTGYIRGTRFDNGVSVDPMPVRDALRLGAACAVQDMEGRVISPNYMEFEDASTITGMDVTPPQSKTVVEQAQEAIRVAEETKAEDEVVDFYDPNDEHAEPKKWTLEALEAIAD